MIRVLLPDHPIVQVDTVNTPSLPERGTGRRQTRWTEGLRESRTVGKIPTNGRCIVPRNY